MRLSRQKSRCDNITRSVVVISAMSLLMLLTLNSCSESQNKFGEMDVTSNDSATNLDKGLVLQVPEDFAQSRAIVNDNLFAVVSAKGFTRQIFQQSTQASIAYPVKVGETLEIVIQWFEILEEAPDGLLLATYELTRENVTESDMINVPSGDYTTTGDIHDEDKDGFSNLTERLAGSNPLLASNTPVTAPDVRINGFNPEELDAPVIDGSYDRSYSNAPAQFNDVNGELLSIDNLLIDQGASRANGDTEFRWFAMHDGTFLYLFVFGESAALATPIRDSSQAWQDDSIDIFIDGNHSKGTVYDGIDDRHIIIPLLTDKDDVSGSNTTYFEEGPSTAPLPDFSFATCLCPSENTWEVRLPMAEFGISPGNYFGIDIQLNEDNDGGARDSKWAWFHQDSDDTFKEPRFMGTAIIR